MRNIITIKETIVVNLPQAAVWEFTQDYRIRPRWDRLIKSSVVMQEEPRTVAVKGPFGTEMTFIYKDEKRPYKTSLAMVDVKSPIIESGGGAWSYQLEGNTTIWTQVNTIVLKNNILGALLLPIAELIFQRLTLSSMQRAKDIMEKESPAGNTAV